MSIVAPTDITLTPGTHRFFDDLVTALASQAALSAGYISHAHSTDYRFRDEMETSLGCLTKRDGKYSLEIGVKPEPMLTLITKFDWPTSLELKFRVMENMGSTPVSASQTAPTIFTLTGIQRLLANIIEHAFIAYYERYSDEINNSRSTAGVGGLPTLAFANAIRNAFAHGGIIHIINPSVTVSWGGLSYSNADNGRQIMYNDMSQGDVILLMLEMDKLF